ncbi:MAG: hypothetical protein A2V67_04745, partial [Deltaproteobacteria bacterium RBG_13_61_14]
MAGLQHHHIPLHESWLRRLKQSNPEIYQILAQSSFREQARERLYQYLYRCERRLLSRWGIRISPLERANTRECLRVFRSVISPLMEAATNESSLKILHDLVQGKVKVGQEVTPGFVEEFRHLFRGVVARSGIYRKQRSATRWEEETGRRAARLRSEALDQLAEEMLAFEARYQSGLEPEVIKLRQTNVRRIRRVFKATARQWRDWHWQLRHVVRDEKTLGRLIELSPEEQAGIRAGREHRVPFGITPYYVSLMDPEAGSPHDQAVRAQVIPSLEYVNYVVQSREDPKSLDFMREADTSPQELITRRYPSIAILKPYNTCSQICVYCQRNWEVEEVLSPGALASKPALDRAVKWFAGRPGIYEVLITGGDPLVLATPVLRRILEPLANLPHITRLRIGTRTPAVLPQRLDPELVRLLARLHAPGRREVALVTHFEHPSEATPEAAAAIARVRRAGISLYNQQVFTRFNSRRFETAALRRALRLIGVDP